MLPVVWLSPALDDLREIATYIAWENPSAARRLKSLLQEAIEPVAIYIVLGERQALASSWLTQTTSWSIVSPSSASRS
ncbi:Addiction module toxin, RelE/StbE family [Pseudomonas amygdali pv. photiniae]|uniref:Addiction module toxin, RelE/StbE family n=1 Tax=Pseudomonas amygdali pv. photiniae TaxID=251724 RepID=A0A0P9SMD8_PSEA0|nr:Addiction module toxin, RelE/StbE family [Pseudomonas amygdali pv. photiniae]